MQITRQADYAIRAVHYLCNAEPSSRTATKEIATDKLIPPSFLAKIISQLSIAGIIQTSRGSHGGVSLSKPPEEISLLDVIEAIDGPITLNECTSDYTNCEFADDCPMRPVWQAAQTDLTNRLKKATFDQFISENGREKEPVLP